MKKILVSLSAAFALFSCAEDDFGTASGGLGTISYNVTVVYDDNNPNTTNGNIVPNATVTLININTNDEFVLQTNQLGQVNATNLLPGTYNIKAVKTLTASEFEDLFGYPESEEVITFNGNLSNTIININITAGIVEIKQAKTGDLLIKQVYYGGSHNSNGASIRDQFIEIYNNSNQEIFVDGLYIGQLFGSTTTTPAQAVIPFSLSTGQWDWSRSINANLTSGNANTDYVYADYVIQIPGNGTQYPLQPGQSIIVAQTAINHRSPIVGPDGGTVGGNTINPDLTVDLSTADFEAYMRDFMTSVGKLPLNSDIENPAVPNVNISYWGTPGAYSGSRDLIFDTFGRDSFVIFRHNDLESLNKLTLPNVSILEESSQRYLQIPVSNIIDGVDFQHNNANTPRPKMLPANVDASDISIPGTFNSYSVMRKTKNETPEGRKILKDTNNSREDFGVIHVNPRGFIE